MKKIFLVSALAIGVLTGAFAQNERPARGERKERTAEQRAEMRTKHMKESLTLSDEQYQKVLAINLEQEKKRDEFRKEQRENIAAARKELKANHEALLKNYEGVLSNEQMTKYNEEAKKRRAEMRKNWRRGRR